MDNISQQTSGGRGINDINDDPKIYMDIAD